MTATAYKKLEVSVSFQKGRCTQMHTFRLDAEKLPQSLGVEALRVTVDKKTAAASRNQDVPVNPNRIAGRGAMGLKKVEITLPDVMTADVPTWKKYDLIPVPRTVRTFFPHYKEDFLVHTPRGEFVVAIASAHDGEKDKYRGGYISRGVSALLEEHSDLQPGDVLVFKKAGHRNVGGVGMEVYTMRVKTP